MRGKDYTAVILGSLSIVSVTVLLVMGIPASSIIAVFGTAITSVISLVLYRKSQDLEKKVDVIEKNTNGISTERDEILRQQAKKADELMYQYLEFLKRAPAVKE